MSSLSDLAMLVNDNFDKPLNQQIRDMQYLGSYLFTSSTTFSPDKNGYYKVVVVGCGGYSMPAGNDYDYIIMGGSGAVAISTLQLNKNESYAITIINNGTSYNEPECCTFAYADGVISAGNGANGRYSKGYKPGVGGTATGGQFNYKGLDGFLYDGGNNHSNGVDVGVCIPSLMKIAHNDIYTNNQYNIQHQYSSGQGILGYGAGGGCVTYYNIGSAIGEVGKGCVLIIPVELQE